MTDTGLEGRAALVTGASRRRGIGFAVAMRLARMGASVVVHHHAAHDEEIYGAAEDLDTLLEELRTHLHAGATVSAVAGDLGTADGPAEVVRQATETVGHLDVLVC